MNGHQHKKNLLMKRNFKKLNKEDLMTSNKLPKGGFGLEKVRKATTEDNICKYGKLPNGATLVKPCDRTAPPPPKQRMVKFKNGSKIYSIDCNDSIRGQSASNIWIDREVLCHTCSNKDICKYQVDYLEQVVHIIDVYDGVFELNCSHYECIKIDDGVSNDIIDEHLSMAIHSKNHKKYCSMISAMKDKDDELLKRIIKGEDLTEVDLK